MLFEICQCPEQSSHLLHSPPQLVRILNLSLIEMCRQAKAPRGDMLIKLPSACPWGVSAPDL